MKKFLALIIVLLLTFSFTLVSCDELSDGNDGAVADGSNSVTDVGGEIENTKKETSNADKNSASDNTTVTPERIYENINNALSSIENITITSKQTADTTMVAGGVELPIKKVEQTVIKKFDDKRFAMIATNNSTSGLDCKYVDGVIYNVREDDGSKVKCELTKDELIGITGVDLDDPQSLYIPAEWFENAKIRQEKSSGRQYVEFSLEGDAYKVLFPNYAALNAVSDVNSVSFKVYVTAEGMIDSAVSTAVIIVDMDGVSVTVKLHSVSTYSDVGATVVEAPEDADSYTTVELSQIL